MNSNNHLLHPMELSFQLFSVLNSEALCEFPRFKEHSRETFDAVLDTANKIATEKFLPHNHLADQNEPTFDGKTVSMIDDVKSAFDAYREAGFIASRYDYEDGGMQLPETIAIAVSVYFMAANPSSSAYAFLTGAAANVIKHFASEKLQASFLPRMLKGTFTGTMALTEPHAGSSLADIKTSATPQPDGTYLIKGSKIYISGGDHELSENIVHLVLAKIPGGPEGVKGISLFVVPKYRLDSDDKPSKHNDVNLAGLLHKLGYRGTTSTVLSFGEKDDCVGYLVGEPHFGLRYMFMMMNEARIGVGLGAASIGYRGFQYSLDYAKERTQGRIPPKDKPSDKPASIIKHGDVKRMLLAQKAYSEGGIALCLYGANLLDRISVCEDKADKKALQELLDLMTPIIKSWPSEFGPKANDLGIQVLGGAGYTREYFAEQFWRDNRLNPIHEGTNGIQALDLAFRKIWQANGLGLQTLQKEIAATIQTATGSTSSNLARKLAESLAKVHEIISVLASKLAEPNWQKGLSANAQAFMNIVATVVVSWIWLQQVIAAELELQNTSNESEMNFYLGKISAAQYYFSWELPLIYRDIEILTSNNLVCNDVQPEWL